jgi:hypothetical protein
MALRLLGTGGLESPVMRLLRTMALRWTWDEVHPKDECGLEPGYRCGLASQCGISPQKSIISSYDDIAYTIFMLSVNGRMFLPGLALWEHCTCHSANAYRCFLSTKSLRLACSGKGAGPYFGHIFLVPRYLLQ